MSSINSNSNDLLGGCSLLLLAHAAAALTSRLDLLLEGALTLLFDFESVDVLDQDTLVPEFVTLSLKVKLAIEVLVDLLLLPEVNECAADDADTADPLPLVVEPGILGTTALTEAPVTARTLREDTLTVTCLRMHSNGAAVDNAVADQFADLLTRIGHSD